MGRLSTFSYMRCCGRFTGWQHGACCAFGIVSWLLANILLSLKKSHSFEEARKAPQKIRTQKYTELKKSLVWHQRKAFYGWQSTLCECRKYRSIYTPANRLLLPPISLDLILLDLEAHLKQSTNSLSVDCSPSCVVGPVLFGECCSSRMHSALTVFIR